MKNLNAENTLLSGRIFTLFAAGLAVLLTTACSQKDPDIEKGAAIYTEVCKVCHAQGLNGAPILGNEKMWSKRTGKGLDALVSNASNGVGLMPAKGGRTELTDDEIRYVVKFMLSQLEDK
ncbi:MAG: c-type cytochrome [Cellvibrionaceae bacterium]